MTKNCHECGEPLTVSTGTTNMGPGHEAIILEGVTLSTCPNGHTGTAIPSLSRAVALIAAVLVTKPWRLAPGEIKVVRRAAGLKSKDMAAALGVSPNTVTRWEKGTVTPLPTADRAVRLVGSLGGASGLRIADLAEVDDNRHEPMPIRLRWDGVAWHRVPVEAAA